MKRVLYHGNCVDGFAAAWAVWRALGEGPSVAGGGATYHPVMYGQPFPMELLTDDVDGVVLADFSYPREVLQEVGRRVVGLLVLEHHRSAEVELQGLPGVLFDVTRSGAGLAWDHLHGRISRPWLIDYVEDRDLWRFALHASRQINAYIATTPFTFEAFEWISRASRSAPPCASSTRKARQGGRAWSGGAGRADMAFRGVPSPHARPDVPAGPAVLVRVRLRTRRARRRSAEPGPVSAGVRSPRVARAAGDAPGCVGTELRRR